VAKVLLTGPHAISKVILTDLLAPGSASPPSHTPLQNPFVEQLTVVAYIFLNNSLNMANKWALGIHGFRSG